MNNKHIERDFIQAAECGDMTRLNELVEQGFSINFQEPKTGLTALHYIAAGGSRKSLRALMANEDCSYYVRDKKGRLPSELAILFGDDTVMARLLAIKEKREALSRGLIPTRRPMKVEA